MLRHASCRDGCLWEVSSTQVPAGQAVEEHHRVDAWTRRLRDGEQGGDLGAARKRDFEWHLALFEEEFL